MRVTVSVLIVGIVVSVVVGGRLGVVLLVGGGLGDSIVITG